MDKNEEYTEQYILIYSEYHLGIEHLEQVKLRSITAEGYKAELVQIDGSNKIKKTDLGNLTDEALKEISPQDYNNFMWERERRVRLFIGRIAVEFALHPLPKNEVPEEAKKEA